MHVSVLLIPQSHVQCGAGHEVTYLVGQRLLHQREKHQSFGIMWIACGRPHTDIVSDIMRKRDCNIMRQLELQENKSQTLLTVVLLLRYVKIDLVIFGVRRNDYVASAVALVVLLMA